MKNFRKYDLAVLVADRNHPKFGSIARILWFDPNACEDFEIKFADDSKADIPTAKLYVYYRRADSTAIELDLYKESGPISLVKRYLELGGNKETLYAEYKVLFNEELKISYSVQEIVLN